MVNRQIVINSEIYTVIGYTISEKNQRSNGCKLLGADGKTVTEKTFKQMDQLGYQLLPKPKKEETVQ